MLKGAEVFVYLIGNGFSAGAMYTNAYNALTL